MNLNVINNQLVNPSSNNISTVQVSNYGVTGTNGNFKQSLRVLVE